MKLAMQTLLVAAFLAGAADAQRAGDLPPALAWDKLKGECPPSLDWASLRGQVVVLSVKDSFPDEMTEWKQLVETFQGESVVFLLSYSGAEFFLDQALEQTSYRGCVLFDQNNVNGRGFGAGGNSGRTIVIDDRGYIAGFSRNWTFDGMEPVVRSVLRRQPSSGLLATAAQPRLVHTNVPDLAPSSVVRISLAETHERRALGLVLGETGQYVSRNQPLKNIIFDLWEIPPARILFPDALDDRRYDVVANIPLADEALVRTLVQEAVEKYFGLRIEKETRVTRAYALTAGGPSRHLQPAHAGETDTSSGGEGFISATAEDMQEIANAFQDLLGVPVIDRTGFEGKYDYWAASRLRGPASVPDMAHQLGLELEETVLPVETLVVEKLW